MIPSACLSFVNSLFCDGIASTTEMLERAFGHVNTCLSAS